MKLINEEEKIDYYIEKYNINNFFSSNMRKYMTFHKWKCGEFVCKEGEPLNYIYFLVKGNAKVYKNFENGKSLLICFYNPVKYNQIKIIGDLEFLKNSMADCSIRVIKDVYAIAIKLDEVKNILLNDCKFLRRMCEYLGEKLSSNSTNSAINLLYPLENRLASYIVAYLNTDEEESVEDGKVFKFEGNYTEIAELLGTSYRHLNRTIKKMCDDKIIQKEDKGYKVLEYNKLLSLSGELYK